MPIQLQIKKKRKKIKKGNHQKNPKTLMDFWLCFSPLVVSAHLHSPRWSPHPRAAAVAALARTRRGGSSSPAPGFIAAAPPTLGSGCRSRSVLQPGRAAQDKALRRGVGPFLPSAALRSSPRVSEPAKRAQRATSPLLEHRFHPESHRIG